MQKSHRSADFQAQAERLLKMADNEGIAMVLLTTKNGDTESTIDAWICEIGRMIYCLLEDQEGVKKALLLSTLGHQCKEDHHKKPSA